MPKRSSSYDNVPNPNPHRTLRRTESRVGKLKRQVSQGAGAWLGLSEQDQGDATTDRWLQRRAALHGKGSLLIGSGLSQKCKNKLECQEDIALPTPRDPLHRPGRAHVHDEPDGLSRPLSQSSAITRSSMGTRRRNLYKKDSVARIAIDSLSLALGFRNPDKAKNRLYSVQSRSLPPASIPDLPEAVEIDTIQEEDSLDDEVFFDNKSHGTSALDLRVNVNLAGGDLVAAGALPRIDASQATDVSTRPMASGWRSSVKPKPPLPGTPGVALDQPDGFKFPTRIVDQVTATVLEKPGKRRFGEGIIGRLFHRELKDYDVEVNVKDQLEDLHDHRPYFTYWITFVQVVVFIVSISVFGIAPIGVSNKITNQDVLVTALYPKTIPFKEPENFWIGPRQIDLIHLGAKFAPCMRHDPNIADLHRKILEKESTTACCVYTDNSGCFQSSKADCNQFRADWVKKDPNQPSGTVCGQDPAWCLSPKGSEWSDNITEWPVCNEKTVDGPSRDTHMKCNILSRPCCIGVKGECQLLTKEHCDAKRGYFHPNATLCSQVKCLGKVCGLINFLNDDSPDQFYRLWLSLILHAGVFHIILTVVFQALIMRDMEKLAGAARVAIIYLGAGLGGNLASAIFLPYHVEVGPAGSQFGILATLWVEVIQSWPLIESPIKALLKVAGLTLFLFILGLLPWIDNYAHMFGFIFGLLLSFAILPYVTFGSQDRKRKLIIKIFSIVLVIVLYVLLFIIFYVTPVTVCKGCRYLNCVPFKADFCENMGVEIEATETKFEWELTGTS